MTRTTALRIGEAAPRSRPGRPSKEEAAETSTRIIDIAAALFAAQGFAATSVEQVVAECNAGKDTIYRRFPSKLALFEAVVMRARQRTLDRLEQEIHAAEGVGDDLTRLKKIARWFLAINLDPQMVAFKRIALSESVVLGEDRAETFERDTITERLISLVAAAQAKGQLRAGDPMFLAGHLLHSIVFGPSNDAMLGRRTYEVPAAQDAYFEQAWDLFLNGASV